MLDAWPKIAAAHAAQAKLYEKYGALEGTWGPSGTLAQIARHFVRLGDELPKANELRLREYRESALPPIWQVMNSEAAIDAGVEIERLTFGLENFEKALGKNDKLVKTVLAGKSPRARAEELVQSTRLGDLSFRKSLIEGGASAVEIARDPMIEMVRSYDAAARAIRKKFEDEVESVERENSGAIAEAHAIVYGKTTYPDATSTPRINFGFVKGYQENGAKILWATALGGIFVKSEMAQYTDPYSIPKRWIDAKPKLEQRLPFNFVTTNDVIGGSSGSPTFDKNGRIVGVVFDQNLAQLPNRFHYREERGRAIHVSSPAIIHVLDKVYGAKELLKELLP
jgi:hypothetical protein